jgi:hypothetical protein
VVSAARDMSEVVISLSNSSDYKIRLREAHIVTMSPIAGPGVIKDLWIINMIN